MAADPMTVESTRAELQALVSTLSAEDAAELLDYARWLVAEYDDEPLTPADLAAVELGKAQIARGEYYTLDELRQRHGL